MYKEFIKVNIYKAKYLESAVTLLDDYIVCKRDVEVLGDVKMLSSESLNSFEVEQLIGNIQYIFNCYNSILNDDHTIIKELSSLLDAYNEMLYRMRATTWTHRPNLVDMAFLWYLSERLKAFGSMKYNP